MTDLFRLSLQLTADAEKAESCLILSMRESLPTAALQGMGRIWVRRTVIRNAIRLVLGANSIVPGNIDCEEVSDFHLQPTEYRIEALRNSLSILRLPDLDRLIFVICVLERYSILDCALLLKRSPKDVNNARLRAINQVVFAEERKSTRAHHNIFNRSARRLQQWNRRGR